MADSLIQDLRLATVVVPSLKASIEAYQNYLGYVQREEGQLAAAYCEALGVPALADAPYVVLGSADGNPGALRFIEDKVAFEGVELPAPLASYGWSALEITVADADGLCNELARSAFTHHAGPADLVFQPGPPGQRAFQAVGPDGEMLYLTQILRQNPHYQLPVPGPRSAVGRLFIMVLAANDYAQTLHFYSEILGMPKTIEVSLPLKLVNRAFGLDPATPHRLATVQTTADTMIEIDGYTVPAHPRPVKPGHLPPLTAMLTLSAASLDPVIKRLEANGTPLVRYSNNHSRTIIITAPGGERLEIIES